MTGQICPVFFLSFLHLCLRNIPPMSIKPLFLLLPAFLLVWSNPLHSQKSDTAKTIFEFMAFGDVLEMELSTDLSLLKDQKKTTEYQPATISFADAGGAIQKWEIKLRSRGKSRRKRF
jgi:hypothetical protein